jgi:hypothetical protein
MRPPISGVKRHILTSGARGVFWQSQYHYCFGFQSRRLLLLIVGFLTDFPQRKVRQQKTRAIIANELGSRRSEIYFPHMKRSLILFPIFVLTFSFCGCSSPAHRYSYHGPVRQRVLTIASPNANMTEKQRFIFALELANKTSFSERPALFFELQKKGYLQQAAYETWMKGWNEEQQIREKAWLKMAANVKKSSENHNPYEKLTTAQLEELIRLSRNGSSPRSSIPSMEKYLFGGYTATDQNGNRKTIEPDFMGEGYTIKDSNGNRTHVEPDFPYLGY